MVISEVGVNDMDAIETMAAELADTLLDGISMVINEARVFDDSELHLINGYQQAIHALCIAQFISHAQWSELVQMMWEMKFGWEPALFESREAS